MYAPLTARHNATTSGTNPAEGELYIEYSAPTPVTKRAIPMTSQTTYRA